MTKKTKTPKTETSKTPAVPKPADGPQLTPEMVTEMRKAGSLEAALAILQPPRQRATSPDARYTFNPACAERLPQKRGACHKVIAIAVLKNGERFTVADIQRELPDVRSAAYWTRKLAASGHLTEVR